MLEEGSGRGLSLAIGRAAVPPVIPSSAPSGKMEADRDLNSHRGHDIVAQALSFAAALIPLVLTEVRLWGTMAPSIAHGPNTPGAELFR